MALIPNSYVDRDDLAGMYGRPFDATKVPRTAQVDAIAVRVALEINSIVAQWYRLPITQSSNPHSFGRLAYGNALGTLYHIHSLEYSLAPQQTSNPWGQAWRDWQKQLGRRSLPDAVVYGGSAETLAERFRDWAQAFFAAHAEANPADVNAAVAAIRAALHGWTFRDGDLIPPTAIDNSDDFFAESGDVISLADVRSEVRSLVILEALNAETGQIVVSRIVADAASNPGKFLVVNNSGTALALVDAPTGGGGGTAPAEWAEEGNLDDIPDGKIPPISYPSLTNKPIILTEAQVNALANTRIGALVERWGLVANVGDTIPNTRLRILPAAFASILTPAERANKVLGFDSTGNAWSVVSPSTGGLTQAQADARADARIAALVKVKALLSGAKWGPDDYILPADLDALSRLIEVGGWVIKTLQTQVAPIATGVYSQVNTVFGLPYADTAPGIGATPNATRYQYFRIADALDSSPDLHTYRLKFGDNPESLTRSVSDATLVTSGGGQSVILGFRHYYVTLPADTIPAGSIIRLEYDEPLELDGTIVQPKDGTVEYDSSSPSNLKRWTGTVFTNIPAHRPVGSIIHNVVGTANIAISARSWYSTGINLPSDLSAKIFAVEFGGESSQMGLFYGASLPDVRTTSTPSATGQSIPFVLRTGEAQAQRIYYLARDNFEVLLASDNNDADASPLRVFEYSVAGAAQTPSATEDVGTAAAVNFTADRTWVDSGIFFPVDYATSLFFMRVGSYHCNAQIFYGADLQVNAVGGTFAADNATHDNLAIGFRSPRGNQNLWVSTDANRRVLLARFSAGGTPNMTDLTIWKVA